MGTGNQKQKQEGAVQAFKIQNNDAQSYLEGNLGDFATHKKQPKLSSYTVGGPKGGGGPSANLIKNKVAGTSKPASRVKVNKSPLNVVGAGTNSNHETTGSKMGSNILATSILTVAQ